jgi:hypothetical protein
LEGLARAALFGLDDLADEADALRRRLNSRLELDVSGMPRVIGSTVSGWTRER